MLSLSDEHNGLTTLRADFGRDLEVNRLSAGYALKTDYAKGRLYAEGRAGYDLRHDRFDASLSAGYQRNDLDIAVVAGRNETQGNFVGVGLKWGF